MGEAEKGHVCTARGAVVHRLAFFWQLKVSVVRADLLNSVSVSSTIFV